MFAAITGDQNETHDFDRCQHIDGFGVRARTGAKRCRSKSLARRPRADEEGRRYRDQVETRLHLRNLAEGQQHHGLL